MCSTLAVKRVTTVTIISDYNTRISIRCDCRVLHQLIPHQTLSSDFLDDSVAVVCDGVVSAGSPSRERGLEVALALGVDEVLRKSGDELVFRAFLVRLGRHIRRVVGLGFIGLGDKGETAGEVVVVLDCGLHRERGRCAVLIHKRVELLRAEVGNLVRPRQGLVVCSRDGSGESVDDFRFAHSRLEGRHIC